MVGFEQLRSLWGEHFFAEVYNLAQHVYGPCPNERQLLATAISILVMEKEKEND